MSRIFFDTNLFIYLLEDEGDRGQRVAAILDRMSQRRDQLITSSMTLGEVLVKPLSTGNANLAEEYDHLLSSPGVTILPFDRGCAAIYARLRSGSALRAPDAIQLSCAAKGSCDLFITNDDRLSRMIVPGIQFIASLDRAAV